MTDREADFDPRFDPRFQPGYDPDAHGEHATRPRHSAAEGTNVASDDADLSILDAEDLAHGGALDAQAQQIQDAAATAPGGTALLLRNPFLWAIVVLGGVLVAWGWSAYSSAIEATSSLFSGGFGSDEEGSQAAYTAAQLALGLAPFAVTVGLLALIGAVFFAAVTWRHGRAAGR